MATKKQNEPPWALEQLEEPEPTGEAIRLRLFDESYVFTPDEAGELGRALSESALEAVRRRARRSAEGR